MTFGKILFCPNCANSTLSAQSKNDIIEELIKALFSLIALIVVGGIAAYFLLPDWAIIVMVILLFSVAYWLAQRFLIKHVCESCGSGFLLKQGKLVELEQDEK